MLIDETFAFDPTAYDYTTFLNTFSLTGSEPYPFLQTHQVFRQAPFNISCKTPVGQCSSAPLSSCNAAAQMPAAWCMHESCTLQANPPV